MPRVYSKYIEYCPFPNFLLSLFIPKVYRGLPFSNFFIYPFYTQSIREVYRGLPFSQIFGMPFLD